MGYAARASNGESPRELTDRKFQHVAVATIDRHAGAIGQLVEAINITNEQARVSREFVADLSVRLDELKRSAEHVSQQYADAINLTLQEAHRYAEPLRRPFLGRLRWLLTGK